jgi:hypothetical protein
MKGERYARPSEERELAKRQQQIDDTANWEDIADEMPDTPTLAAEYRDILDRIKELEKRKDELKPQLEAAVIIGGKKALAAGSYRITRVESNRKSLSAEKLVEKGVTIEILAECIIITTSSYPLVTRVKEDIVRDEA